MPLGKVKSSSMFPFHFPINPRLEFWYEGESDVRIVRNEPFAAGFSRIPFSNGVTMDNVSFTMDTKVLLPSTVKFSLTVISCWFASTRKTPGNEKWKRDNYVLAFALQHNPTIHGESSSFQKLRIHIMHRNFISIHRMIDFCFP